MNTHSSAAVIILAQLESSFPFVMTRALIVPVINTPTSVPHTFPTPPVRRVPPITAAAMASISSPFACCTYPFIVFMQYRIPPNEHSAEESTYASIFVFFTLSPIITALVSLPPTAYRTLPNLVYFRTI